jgi:hypothetical protein
MSAWHWDEVPTVYADNTASRCAVCNHATGLLVTSLTTLGLLDICGKCLEDGQTSYRAMMAARMSFDISDKKATHIVE